VNGSLRWMPDYVPGWPAGPDYEASGATGLLFLLKDPNDTNPDVKPRLTADFWNMLSDVILENLF